MNKLNKLYVALSLVLSFAYTNIQAMEIFMLLGKELLKGVNLYVNEKDKKQIYIIKERIQSKNSPVINYQDPVDETFPLYVAATGGNFNLTQALLQAGANPNLQTKTGNTALHSAAEKGYNKIVELLLNKGANPTLKNSQGKTPSDVVQGLSTLKELLNARIKQLEELDHKEKIEEDKKNKPDTPEDSTDTSEEEIEEEIEETQPHVEGEELQNSLSTLEKNLTHLSKSLS